MLDMCFMTAQVEMNPIPHVIVDVRRPEDIAYSPLPEALGGGVIIPGDPIYTMCLHPKEVGSAQQAVSISTSKMRNCGASGTTLMSLRTQIALVCM